MKRGRRNVPLIGLYANAIRVVTVESVNAYFGSSDGYNAILLDDPPAIRVTPSQSIYPHLQHCHIIWAMERIVEIAYHDRDFHEASGSLFVKRGSKWVEVGQLSMKQEEPTASSAPSGIFDLNQRNSTLQLAGREVATLAPSKRNVASNSQMLVEAGYVAGGKPLKPLDVFLTVVRAIALLAEPDTNAKVNHWEYVDVDTRIRIYMTSPSGKSTKTNYGDVVECLSFATEFMLKKKRFAEIVATMFEMKPLRVDHGWVEIMKDDSEASI